MTARPTAIAPVLLVADVAASAAYWRDMAGFDAELFNDPPDFAIVSRGAADIMLQQVSPGAKIVPNWHLREKTADVFVWVDDVRALYEELTARGAIIDWMLYRAPWGGLEFGIQDLDDHDIAFAQLPESETEET